MLQEVLRNLERGRATGRRGDRLAIGARQDGDRYDEQETGDRAEGMPLLKGQISGVGLQQTALTLCHYAIRTGSEIAKTQCDY